MTDQEVLATLEATGALLSGHFELRSKLHSNRFFQCANVLKWPRHAQRLCDELVCRMRARMDIGPVDGVVSPALGGILVGHEVARALDTQCLFAEKADGALVMRRFKLESGKRYVVAEDVITRGGRVQETIDIVKAAGAEVAAVLVLVDRSAGNAKFDYPTFSLLQMAPEVWEPVDCPMCKAGEPFVHPGS
ncbi:MAG: orotate phosphoribosyltransferase [Kiritimatiellia bacterium]|nr:orotate phosphoribosyltransferase [Kiritimatiellia bacterium]